MTCKMGNVERCVHQAEQLYKNHSYTKALRSYERACAMDDGHGCHWAAFMYIHGEGIGADKRIGTQLYQKACALKQQRACLGLAQLHAQSRDHERALKLSKQICAQELAEGCWMHAQWLRQSHGHKQATAILASYNTACRLGHQASCQALKTPYVTYPQDVYPAIERCKRGTSYACYRLGRLLDARWYKKACRLGHWASCDLAKVPRTKRTPRAAVPNKNTFTETLRRKAGWFQFCYERVLKYENIQAFGKITLKITVKPNGENIISTVSVSPKIASITHCMEHSLASLSYPVEDKLYAIEKTFVFSTSGHKTLVPPRPTPNNRH